MNRSSTRLIALLLLTGCLEPYSLPTKETDLRTLVVDGFLDATKNKVTVKLSRTIAITSTPEFVPEPNATVFVEAEAGDRVDLTTGGDGLYTASVDADITKRYRLGILVDDKKYYSSFENVGQTPAIDTVGWRAETEGVAIKVSTHGPNLGPQYYLWRYDETWEYRSTFESLFTIDKGKWQPRLGDETIYKCWRDLQSYSIHVASTDKLNQNTISNFTLFTIPHRSEKLNFKYSILVRQAVIDEKAYAYWQMLKKNTEQLGSLFDPQPSHVTGNITADNGEDVIGYFFASTVDERRIFIRFIDLPETHRYYPNPGYCEQDTVLVADLPKFDGRIFNLTGGVWNDFGAFIGFLYADRFCTDCTLQGGSRVQPEFWR